MSLKLTRTVVINSERQALHDEQYEQVNSKCTSFTEFVLPKANIRLKWKPEVTFVPHDDAPVPMELGLKPCGYVNSRPCYILQHKDVFVFRDKLKLCVGHFSC
jgi:hypothetical protein